MVRLESPAAGPSTQLASIVAAQMDANPSRLNDPQNADRRLYFNQSREIP
jgi:hypothetical protein